jgi:restriction endonuclease S subunit
VPAASQALADYLLFHFLTVDGLASLREASPGGAGRNRTLGLQALAAIEVPVPSIQEQQGFVEILRLRDDARARRKAAEARCQALVPVLLHSVFSATFGIESSGHGANAAVAS